MCVSTAHTAHARAHTPTHPHTHTHTHTHTQSFSISVENLDFFFFLNYKILWVETNIFNSHIIPQAALQPCPFPCLLVPFPRVRSLAFIILNIFTYLLIVSDLPTPLAFSPLCRVCTLPQHTLAPRALAGRSWGTGSLAVDFLTLTLKTAEVEREKQPSLLHKIFFFP